MRRILSVLAAAALMSCAPNAVPSEEGAATADGSEIAGIVRVVGSAPVDVRVVLQTGSAGSLELTGALRDELASLSGAEVAVRGPRSTSPDPLASGRVEVREYEVISVDGEPVVVGEIVRIAGGRATLRTEGGDEWILSSVPESIRVGQKVWVQGPSTLAVQTYGVIRR